MTGRRLWTQRKRVARFRPRKSAVFAAKWDITAGLLIILGFMLKAWFVKEERTTWVQSTWKFMKHILPLLGAGVLVAGFMLGRPGHPALIPEHYVASLVGEG